MIIIKEITDDDLQKHHKIFQSLYKVMGSYDGIFLKYEINGIEKFLHKIDNFFIVSYYKEDKSINIDKFTVDVDYNIANLECDDYEIYFNFGIPVFVSRDGNKLETFSLLKLSDSLDIDGYNGRVCYSEYTQHNHIKTDIAYQINIHKNMPTISQENLLHPFSISIEKDIGKLKLYRKLYTVMKAQWNTPIYDLITLKEFGYMEYKKKGALKLQQASELRRYMKTAFLTKDKYSVSFFPFCKLYKEEDMHNMMMSLNHNWNVPKYILDFYMGNHHPYFEYKDLALLVKQLEANYQLRKSKGSIIND